MRQRADGLTLPIFFLRKSESLTSSPTIGCGNVFLLVWVKEYPVVLLVDDTPLKNGAVPLSSDVSVGVVDDQELDRCIS